MRGKTFAIMVGLAMLAAVAGGNATAGSRIFRCVGPGGALVFRDQPCSRAGLSDAGASKPALFQSPANGRADVGRCVFTSKPLQLADPVFDQTRLRLVIEVDDDGPYLSIIGTGKYVVGAPVDAAMVAATTNPESAEVAQSLAGVNVAANAHEVPATFNAGVSSQGLQMLSGGFHEADWRKGEQTLGFGRSRMRNLLTALSREEASVVVWFQGFGQPVQSASIPTEQFRLALDNVRRCWKTQVTTLKPD
jgi:hypothetical protein